MKADVVLYGVAEMVVGDPNYFSTVSSSDSETDQKDLFIGDSKTQVTRLSKFENDDRVRGRNRYASQQKLRRLPRFDVQMSSSRPVRSHDSFPAIDGFIIDRKVAMMHGVMARWADRDHMGGIIGFVDRPLSNVMYVSSRCWTPRIGTLPARHVTKALLYRVADTFSLSCHDTLERSAA